MIILPDLFEAINLRLHYPGKQTHNRSVLFNLDIDGNCDTGL